MVLWGARYSVGTQGHTRFVPTLREAGIHLILENGVAVRLSGGALAQNIFWQIAGKAVLGTTSQFEGIILCKTLISMNTGASVNGRLLAQTAVTLQKNAVTRPKRLLPSR